MKQQSQKVVAIIQARMGSSRLPGKVLKPLGGFPMLEHVIRRTRKSLLVDEILVATTISDLDYPIVEYCQKNQISVYQGDEYDVLDRFYQAAKFAKADVIVRLTADCPLMDPKLIDDVLQAYNQTGVDFAANRLPPPWKRTYPIGLDVEVVSYEKLEQAWKVAEQQFEREHVMPFFYDQPGRYKTLLLHHEIDLGQKRWTVDTQQDLEMLEKVFDHFRVFDDFTWLDVYEWLSQNPDIEKINAEISHKTVTEIDQRYLEEK